jgi:LCP family protein required for cell wall assembly
MGAEGAADEGTTTTPFRRRHTAGQRVVLAVNCLVVVACLVAALGLLIAKHAAEQGQRVALASPRPRPTSSPNGDTLPLDTTSDSSLPGDSIPATTVALTTTTIADFQSAPGENFLVVGVDNNACIDPNSPYAPFIGPRTEHLTDTIMMIRLDREARKAAVLSFPRDLWVRVNGSLRRINTAFQRNDPQPLIDTIYNEFGIVTDHFIGVDFCAFMRLVDAVGGITIPLPYPVRDLKHTGLNVEQAGCHTFAGDEALAYVRSRYLEYQNKAGRWIPDKNSDFGRIARQQDFIRRLLSAAKQHLLNASVLRGLYDTYHDDLVIDDKLTISDMLQLSEVLRDVDTSTLRSYQVEVTGKRISGQDVLIADQTDENSAILDIFRGRVPVAGSAVAQLTAFAPRPASATSARTTAVPIAPEPNAPKTAIVPDPAAQC